MKEISKRNLSNVSLCSFADDSMSVSQETLLFSAINNGFLTKNIYSFCKRGTDFYGFDYYFLEGARNVLKEERGCGYWSWKPYIIHRSMESIEYGDWLLYLDSGIEIIGDVSELIDENEEVILFHNVWKHMDWCKMDTLKDMLPNFDDTSKSQLQASAMLIKKTTYTKKLIAEWMNKCLDKHMIDDSPSVLPNIPTFREHRHDQAILTNLAIRDSLKTREWDDWITYDRNNLNSKIENIPILFYHHRKRNNEWQ